MSCADRARYPSLEQARVAVRAAGTGDHVRFCRRCCGWHTTPPAKVGAR